MIIRVQKAIRAPEKNAADAVEFWDRISSFLKKQPGAKESFVMRPMQGQNSRLFLATRFSSLTAWAEYWEKRTENPEWQALFKEWKETKYTVSGSLEYNTYEVL